MSHLLVFFIFTNALPHKAGVPHFQLKKSISLSSSKEISVFKGEDPICIDLDMFYNLREKNFALSSQVLNHWKVFLQAEQAKLFRPLVFIF
jgi:hypothetical protein